MGGARRLTAALLLIGASLFVPSASEARFPDVDYSKLRIKLQRSACYGSCPDYSVTIAGDGSVVFTTDTRPVDPVSGLHREFSRSVGVVVPGTHRTQISPDALKALVEQFRDARFFDLKNAYEYGATDAPTYVVSIATGHGAKAVRDYIGLKAGMPKSVRALEDAIDKVAGTGRWIDGTPEAIAPLQAEHADFHGRLGVDLLIKAAERDDIATLERLAGLGAPLVIDHSSPPLTTAANGNHLRALSWLVANGAAADPQAAMAALASAVSGNSDASFHRLRALVSPAAITPRIATKLLRDAASNGNPAMVGYFLQFHPDLGVSGVDGLIDKPALFEAAQGRCAGEVANGTCDSRRVVRMLLDAGSDARWADPKFRQSIFFLVSDPEIARMLLAAGADPNFKDFEGEPVIFSIDNEDVALVLLDAGLSIRAVRPADKMTLRGWATYQKWPRVLARLDRAGL